MTWLDPETKAWAEPEAAAHHDGAYQRSSPSVLRATRAEQAPKDPWAALEERSAERRWPPQRIPTTELITFVHNWDPAHHGEHATDVLAAIRGPLGLPPR